MAQGSLSGEARCILKFFDSTSYVTYQASIYGEVVTSNLPQGIRQRLEVTSNSIGQKKKKEDPIVHSM